MSLKDVLDHSGVACEDLACGVGVAEDEGDRGWGLEDVWEPLEAVVSVGEKGEEWTH